MSERRMKMTGEISAIIRLEDAFFCLDCEIITSCSDVCPVCGNHRLWFLQNWLGSVGDQENSKSKKPTIREFQPATQKIFVNHAERAISAGLIGLRKKLLC